MNKPTIAECIWASCRLSDGLWHLNQALIEIDRARGRFPELDKFYNDLNYALHEASHKSMVKEAIKWKNIQKKI